MEATGSDKPETPTREFHLARRYRRSAWYALFGAVCSSTLLIGLKLIQLVPDRSWTEVAITCVVFIGSAGLLVVAANSWRLRIDGAGIARRRFWIWDYWSWDEFADGRLTRSGGTEFQATAHPFWRSKLAFGLLEDDDRDFALGVCRHYFQSAPASDEEKATDFIELRYHLISKVIFHQDGIRGRNSRGSYEFDWSGVNEIRFFCYDRWSTDARKLEIETPSRLILVEAPHGVRTAAKRHPGTRHVPPMVERFVRENAKTVKILRFVAVGPPESLEEYTHRRRKLEKDVRTHRAMMIFGAVVGPAGVLAAFGPKLNALRPPIAGLNPNWNLLLAAIAVFFISVYALFLWAPWFFLRKEAQTRMKELHAWREGAAPTGNLENGSANVLLKEPD